jgi:hypothetical protein
LLILDNLEDVATARAWLGRLSGGPLRVLLTARLADWPGDLGLAALRLDTFSPEESRVFLKQMLETRFLTFRKSFRLPVTSNRSHRSGCGYVGNSPLFASCPHIH